MKGARQGSGRGRPLDRTGAQELIERLSGDARRIAGHFRLLYRAIVAERPSVTGHYGICYEDGLIKIRLQHATRRTPLKYSSLVHTLCHELAHLQHFDHGAGFRAFLARILAWARSEGIYRPGRPSRAGEASPPLDCGVAPEERRRFLEEMRRAVRPPAHHEAVQLSLFSE